MAPTATEPSKPAAPAPKRRVHFSKFDVTDQTFYETESVAAIVNLKPIVPGHVLVIPQTPYKRLTDVPDAEVGAMFTAAKRIGGVLERVFGGDALTVSVQDGASAGQTVDHVHIHVLPRRSGDIVPKDAMYDHLERFGLELVAAQTNGVHQLDSERRPRSKEQMSAEAAWLREQMRAQGVAAREGKLPVTLLSGFLGSGKTTLLQRILSSHEHGLRIAVIVNDMGELNIDSRLIANHQVSQSKERLVEMTNGCVCCTLRGDLLEEVSQLAANRQIDYLLIESSGIAEPMQVCETFSDAFAEMHAQAALDLQMQNEQEKDEAKTRSNSRIAEILERGGLPAITRLDTCLTIVDAANMLSDFSTTDFLIDRYNKETVPEEDDRNISDLMVDQIEFANVVIVNKCDMVSPDEVKRIRAIITQLNPDARIITTAHCDVELSEILNTHMFSYEKAATSAGWLKSLNEDVIPETEEYGIGSFVYRARRPFHPERLWNAVRECFVVIQSEFIDDGEDGPENEDGEQDGEQEAEEDGEADGEADEPMDEDEAPQLNPAARLECKKASPVWNPLLRSKGFLWLATRPLMFGEWSQAGIMLTLTGGGRWRCELPKEFWPEDKEIVDAIMRDFDPNTPWGDRRQEIVFIGTEMKKGAEQRIREVLDRCLLTDDEWKTWVRIMSSKSKKLATMQAKQEELQREFADGFEDWPDMEDPEQLEHDGHDHHHSHHH